MKPYYTDATVTVHHGDCLDVLATMADSSVDSVCTDPPYGLEFMGKEWDRFGGEIVAVTDTGTIGRQSSTPFAGGDQRIRFGAPGLAFQSWCQLWATECLRILKPGGHLLAFGGTRTAHRLTCAIEDAGFEIRDSIAWLYGSGFPKSLDVSKAIDRAAGAEREVVGIDPRYVGMSDAAKRAQGAVTHEYSAGWVGDPSQVTAPATDAARQWHGWGTALKPAHEPITVARKPLAGTVAANVVAHGVGALNVDGCRVEGAVPSTVQGQSGNAGTIYGADQRDQREFVGNPAGRWPANVVLDEDAAAELDRQSGELTSGNPGNSIRAEQSDASVSYADMAAGSKLTGFGDTGGASRFFYTAKAGSAERIRHDGTAHPTVKPLSLMRWLVRLVTPPGGVCLDPFAGSGTTAEACILEGFRCIAIEREVEYLPLIVQRINRRRDPVAYVRAAGSNGPASLFDLDGGAA